MDYRINAVALAMEKGTPVDERDRDFAERAGDLLVLLRENQCATGELLAKRVKSGVSFVDPENPGDHVRWVSLSRENGDLWAKLREVFNATATVDMDTRISAAASAMEKGTPVDEKDRAFAARAGDLLLLLRKNQRDAGVLYDKYVKPMGVNGEIMTYDDPTPEASIEGVRLSNENDAMMVKLRDIFNE